MSVLKCNSVSKMLNELNLLQSENSSLNWHFRGQGNADWGLVPSLFRLKLSDEKAFEKSVIEVLRLNLKETSTIPDRLLDDDDYLLSLAQHYGTPTRMLDLTLSPLIASYFAASSALKCPTKSNSLAVFCIAGIYTMGQHGEELKFVYPPTGANDNLFAQSGKFLKHEWGCRDLWKYEYNDEISSAVSSVNARIDSRIIRVELPTKFAEELIYELMRRGVNSMNLFPGISGYAKAAADEAWISQKLNCNI